MCWFLPLPLLCPIHPTVCNVLRLYSVPAVILLCEVMDREIPCSVTIPAKVNFLFGFFLMVHYPVNNKDFNALTAKRM